jgi:hypothetical protein
MSCSCGVDGFRLLGREEPFFDFFFAMYVPAPGSGAEFRTELASKANLLSVAAVVLAVSEAVNRQ